MMPVTPRPMSFVAAAWPPSSENRVRSTSSSASADRVAPDAARSNAASLRRDGTWSRRPEDQPDALVTEVGEVRVRLLHRDRVVGRDPREVEVVSSGIHEHDRQPQLEEPRVVVVRRVGLGVLAAGEDHSRDLPLEQHLDVLAPPTCFPCACRAPR